LQLPKFNNVFLTKASFDVFEALFDAQETDMDADKFAGLLRVRLDIGMNMNRVIDKKRMFNIGYLRVETCCS
jgi:hypothetical protein